MNTRTDRPRTGFAYLDAVLDQPGSVLALAHRGGSGHPDVAGFENTLTAFRHAVQLGYHYLETDVHATSDGILVAIHDPRLDRVSDRTGAIADLTAAEVARARIAGTDQVSTLAALFEEFPDCRFNIDVKAASAVRPLVALLDATATHDRVCVGAFDFRRIREFRRLSGGRVPTSAAPTEVAAFLTSPLPRLARLLTGGHVQVLQVPHRHFGLRIVSPALVRRAHAAGAQVHVWTVDEPTEMHELIDMGVDGLFTDRTEILKEVLIARGVWRDHA